MRTPPFKSLTPNTPRLTGGLGGAYQALTPPDNRIRQVVSIRIRTTSPMDDDWRVTLSPGDVVLSDPRQILAPPRDMTFTNEGFVPEAIINIDLYDGAFYVRRFFTWEATINWDIGSPTIITGGYDSGDLPTIEVPAYYPNGTITIPTIYV